MYDRILDPRLYERVVERLELEVLAGRLKPGDKLPPERELAERFGVSRTAVREAVKVVREKGLLESYPGRGTFITNGVNSSLRNSMILAVKLSGLQSSASLVEVREILEPGIAALAATRATEEHLAAMQEAIVTMDGAMDRPDAFVEADLDFHLALAKGTQNPFIVMLVDPIIAVLREQRKAIFTVAGGPQRGQSHHRRIFEALVARDPEKTREAMRAHLQQVREDSQRATITARHAFPGGDEWRASDS